MYRRSLDIAVAAVVAILGGLAAAAHLPGTATIPLGAGLFLAPGYLWSVAILSQRLSGLERTMTSVGMALIFPILGGFLFYGLKIPLFKSSWVGMLVVLSLLGVVAAAIQRLRTAPSEPWQQPRGGQRTRRGRSILHAGIFGLAALIGIGAVAFSVKSADAQKFSGYTMLSMTAVVNNTALQDIANLAGNQTAQADAVKAAMQAQPGATQAHLTVTNHDGSPEQYELKLLKGKKVANTWTFTLADGQTWQRTIPYTVRQGHKMVANLYLLPDVTKPYRTVDNGE